MNRPSALFCCILVVLVLASLAGPSRADFRADSLALFGSWRWVRARGGGLRADVIPPASGWRRVLYLRRDGTYAYWEQDSVANYLLCSGAFTIHPAIWSKIEGGPPVFLWIDLQGWWDSEKRQLAGFLDANTMAMYPGSEDATTLINVADALKNWFVREPAQSIPASSKSPEGKPVYATRPPRLLPGLPGSYYAELPFQWSELLRSTGPLYEWRDVEFPKSVRDSYDYTSHQIPSAVIGDFDGDSTADVAIYGGTSAVWRRSAVVCLLSNRGDPRSVRVLEEPTILDPSLTPDTTVITWREPHPALYLTLWPAGRPFEDSEGNTRTQRTAAITAARLDGKATVFYLDRDRFREGRPKARTR